MDRPSVLMVSSEASPYAKSGGLADVLGALPPALVKLGHRIGVVLPRYQYAYKTDARRVIDALQIPLGGGTYTVGIWELRKEGVRYFFVDHPGLYGRNGLYGDQYGEFGDNHIRFALLSKAAIEIARLLFPADIFHGHDWQAGLLPVYLKTQGAVDPTFIGAKTVMTVHNLGYQGGFNRNQMREVSLPDNLFRPDLMEFYGRCNMLKGGLVFCDAITTVSRKYAEEIQTPAFGFGLDGLLRAREASLTGILNGADYTQWNTANDRYLQAPYGHYSTEDLAGKRVCKAALLKEMGLPEHAIDRPLLGVVSRFASQKGFDLIAEAAWQIFRDDVYLVALGNGEKRYEDLFHRLHDTFPDKVAIWMGYNDQLAHRIEAGADIFLMPSLYEPCGLNQIYSLRYGTVPVVRATGGLDDTITDSGTESTGFKFHDYSGYALLDSIRTAIYAYDDRPAWESMMVRGMKRDFSWDTSALEYSHLYRSLLP